MNDRTRRAFADAWMVALQDERLVAALESIYDAAADAIAARGPACWASGRCCNFDRAGHRLYVTGLEAAYCLGNLMASPIWRNGAAEARSGLTIRGKPLPPPTDPDYAPLPTGQGLIADFDAAVARGGCPFQVRNLCGVHDFKPLGCRVFFCDRSAETWQQELSERLLRDIRALHDRFALEYRYGEWRQMLGMFRA